MPSHYGWSKTVSTLSKGAAATAAHLRLGQAGFESVLGWAALCDRCREALLDGLRTLAIAAIQRARRCVVEVLYADGTRLSEGMVNV